MKVTTRHFTAEVVCLDAVTGALLPERKVGNQIIILAKPGLDFKVCVTATGAYLDGLPLCGMVLAATCSVGE